MSVDIDQIGHCYGENPIAQAHADVLLRTTLDLLPVGLLLVDADALIVHANATARAMLSAGEPIACSCDHLGANHKPTTAALKSATKQVALADRSQPAGIRIPLPYRDGHAAVAHVMPLHLGVPSNGRRWGADVAIFITGAWEQAPPPIDALTVLFNLTPSEGRVLEQIISGRNRRETAAALGIAELTVKTHLVHIYAKTQTSDQLGLYRLVATLSWPGAVTPLTRRSFHNAHL